MPAKDVRWSVALCDTPPPSTAHAGEGVYFSIDPETGCWVWQGNVQPRRYGQGYGRISFGTTNYRAHRVVYEAHRGPIPAGYGLDHLCANPLCVNPDHLEPVTTGENVRRGRRAKLTRADVAEIRWLLAATNLTQKEIGALFGVSRAPVSHIASGRCWYEEPHEDFAANPRLPIPEELLRRFRP